VLKGYTGINPVNAGSWSHHMLWIGSYGMKRRSCNPKGSSARDGNPDARWRAVFIALVLAPMIGGVSQALPTQAAPGQAGVERNEYYLTPSGAGGLDRVCVGSVVVFNVIAERRMGPDGRKNTKPLAQGGVTVSGSVLHPAYGTLTPTSPETSMGSTPPGSAVFSFLALSPGTTELRFTGRVATPPLPNSYRAYVPLTLNVSVVTCEPNPNRQYKQYKVTTISTWSAGMDIVATIDDGVIRADEQGRFTGSASVNWRTSVLGNPGCGAEEARVPPSTADLTGEINASHQLVVRITFQPRDFSGWARCGPSGVSTGNLGTPDPLTIRVATTGGRSTQAQAVTAKNGSFRGSATIIVTPEQD
jgi:hypothetical protein